MCFPSHTVCSSVSDGLKPSPSSSWRMQVEETLRTFSISISTSTHLLPWAGETASLSPALKCGCLFKQPHSFPLIQRSSWSLQVCLDARSNLRCVVMPRPSQRCPGSPPRCTAITGYKWPIQVRVWLQWTEAQAAWDMNAAEHHPDLLERPASLLVPTWVRDHHDMHLCLYRERETMKFITDRHSNEGTSNFIMHAFYNDFTAADEMGMGTVVNIQHPHPKMRFLLYCMYKWHIKWNMWMLNRRIWSFVPCTFE